MYFNKSKLDEIYQAKNLFFLGILLLGLHVINSFFWLKELGTDHTAQICWSSLPHCSQFLGLAVSQVLNKVYICASILGFIGFFLRLRSKGFYFFLLLIFFIKYLIYIAHFNLNSNAHIFLFFAEASLLFVPKKSNSIKYIFTSYLVTLGLLKLNPEWLSGFWLEQHISGLPLKGIEWVAAFALFIELFTPIGLLFKNAKVFFTSILVLFVYAISQVIFLDLFSAISLLGFIVFFIINYYEDLKLDRESIYKSYSEPEPSFAWGVLIPFVYLSLQLFIIWGPQKSSLRDFPLSLRHFPTPLQCQQYTFIHSKNKLTEAPYRFLKSTSSDLDCNKEVALKFAAQFCSQSDSNKVSSIFLTKQGRATEFTTEFDHKNICTEGGSL